MQKHVIAIENKDSNLVSYVFNTADIDPNTLDGETVIHLEPGPITQAIVYNGVRPAKKVLGVVEKEGPSIVVPLHWGLEMDIRQHEQLIHACRVDRDMYVAINDREEAIERYQIELLKMKKMYVKEVPPICIGCKKTPEMIKEYDMGAREAGETPSEHMVEVENTYDKFGANKFYCTACYIKNGMPLISN